MSAGADLFSLLSSFPAVTAIVGAGAAARVYPDAIPLDDPLPAVVYDESVEPIATLHGTVAGRMATLTVACWGTTRTEADALADAVELALLSAGQVWDQRTNSFDGETANAAATLTLSWLAT